jgi:DNA polymerase-3 subunit epsilon
LASLPLSTLKTRIFARATRESLLRMARTLALDEVMERNTYAIIGAIRGCSRASAADLVPQLSDTELRSIGRELGLDEGPREAWVSAILALTDDAAAPLPAPAPRELQGPLAPRATPAPEPSAPRPAPQTPPAAAPHRPLAPATPPLPVREARPSTFAELFAARQASPGPAVGSRPPQEQLVLAPSPAGPARSRRGAAGPGRLPGKDDEDFVAIDFETADHGRDSACAVALVRVERGAIVAKQTSLILPPRGVFTNAHIHGITAAHVRGAPTFGQLWPTLAPLLDGVAYLVAHNAPFDRSVLRACCAAAGLAEPTLPFECSVQMARRVWNLQSVTLPVLCRMLDIALVHHDAASDAEACARVVLAARALRR